MFSLYTTVPKVLFHARNGLVLQCLLIRYHMKSVKHYIHFLWMFLLTVTLASAQASFNPSGYASTLKDALKEPANTSTMSVYYNRGMVFDEDLGKIAPDAPIENVAQLSNLKQCKLNGCPVNFDQEKFFASLSKLKDIEVVELRMTLKRLGGVLTQKSIDYLKKLKNLKRLNLPNQYPSEDFDKLQLLFPNCDIVIDLYPEGE